MILSADVIDNKQNVIPAVTHVDGTARVQTVKKKLIINFGNLFQNSKNHKSTCAFKYII